MARSVRYFPCATVSSRYPSTGTKLLAQCLSGQRSRGFTVRGEQPGTAARRVGLRAVERSSACPGAVPSCRRGQFHYTVARSMGGRRTGRE